MQRYVARSVVTRYAGAIVYVTATVGFALWQRPVVLASAGQLSLVANLITGWVCGLRPALVAWGLATLNFAYFSTSPLDSLRIELVQLPRVAIFTLLGLFMATMSAARRWAEDSLQDDLLELDPVTENGGRPEASSTASATPRWRSSARTSGSTSRTTSLMSAADPPSARALAPPALRACSGNLVMNGIEAMAGIQDRPMELIIGSHPTDGEHVTVAVHDTGVGIDPSHLDRLYNAFFTTKRGGMGMGLSMSRSIIEAHGGRLWAAPNLPHGAIFRLSLAPALGGDAELETRRIS